MVTYPEMVMDFIKDKFGESIGPVLFMKEVREKGISSFTGLKLRDQVDFTTEFLSKRFGQFMRPEDVQTRIMHINLQYCAMKAADEMSKILDKRAEIEPFDIEPESQKGTAHKLRTLRDNDYICHPMKVSESLNGDALFFFTRDGATRIAGHLNPDGTIDSKQQAVQNFISLIVPHITRNVSEVMGNSVLFEEHPSTNTTMEDFMNQMISKVSGPTPEVSKSFHSEVPFKINNSNVGFTVMFLNK